MNTFPKIEITSDHQQILDQADRFAREQLHPLQERMDNEEWWPSDLMKKIAGVGLMGITAPEKWGGAGLDLFTSSLVAQAFGKWNPAVALSWGASENLCMNNILRNADEELKSRYLPGLVDGSLMGALALTEPGAGSDALSGMKTTARREGDFYVLNGTKIFITNGPIADVILVYAKTDPARGAKGISAFIVEKNFPGFSVAQKMVKMGWRGSQTGELVFNDCRVPVKNLVGTENAGVSIVMSGLNLERAYFSAIAVGMAERALELSTEYAKTRKQFGKAIGEFQMIQATLADMYVGLESMRTLTYRAIACANELETGGGGRGEIHKLTAAALLFAGKTCMRILDDAVQIHGGSGLMWEMEVNRLYRAGKLLEIGGGTNEIRRIIISGELLRD